jgi:hypothetical protein
MIAPEREHPPPHRVDEQDGPRFLRRNRFKEMRLQSQQMPRVDALKRDDIEGAHASMLCDGRAPMKILDPMTLRNAVADDDCQRSSPNRKRPLASIVNSKFGDHAANHAGMNPECPSDEVSPAASQ